MIIKSQRQAKKDESISQTRIISRIKLHPSLYQDNKDDAILNFIKRKSSQPKVSSQRYPTSKQSQDDTTWKSKIFLRPLLSRSVEKKLTHRTDVSEYGQSRSDRKILNIRSKSRLKDRLKGNSLKQLLLYDKGEGNVSKMQKIVKAFERNNCQQEVHLDIEEQFYQQVRIAQQFKELSRRTK